MRENNIMRKIIEEVCQEKGIERTNLSYDWIIILKKGNLEKKIVNYRFHLNEKRTTELTNDKYATYVLLDYYGIPMIQHEVLFNSEMMPDWAHANADFNILRNHKKAVIKANDSFQGKDVYLCEQEDQKLQIVKQLFAEGKEMLTVCPFVEIEYEYRAIFLYGEIIYLYKKQKPFVIGDGKLSLKELIERDVVYLTEPVQDLDLGEIPTKGEKVIVGWKHNLSNGAIPILIDETDLYYETIKNMAEKAGKALDLNYATVDIVVTKKQEVLVMEVNSNVCISKFCQLVPNGFEIGKKIYAKVIDKFFEN